MWNKTAEYMGKRGREEREKKTQGTLKDRKQTESWWRDVGGRWARWVMGIKEDSCCDEQRVLYVSDESLNSFIFYFLKIYLFWGRQRDCEQGRGESEGETQAGSVLPVQNSMWGLNPRNCESMTWAEIKNQTLYWLSHPGAHWILLLKPMLHYILTKIWIKKIESKNCKKRKKKKNNDPILACSRSLPSSYEHSLVSQPPASD